MPCPTQSLSCYTTLKAQRCPGNVCEIKDREPIQKLKAHQAVIAGAYVTLLIVLSPVIQSATPQPHTAKSVVAPASINPAEEVLTPGDLPVNFRDKVLREAMPI